LFQPVAGLSTIFRLDGVTGAVIDVFVGPAQGFVRGLGGGIAFGPDGNLFISSLAGIDRYCGPVNPTCAPGEPLGVLGPGQPDATFVSTGLPGLTTDLVFGPDGDLYVSTGNGVIPTDSQRIKRFCGPTRSGCTHGAPDPAPSQPPGSAIYVDAGSAVIKGLAF